MLGIGLADASLLNKGYRGETAFTQAVRHGDFEVVHLLMRQPALKLGRGEVSWPQQLARALQHAGSSGNLAMATFLLRHCGPVAGSSAAPFSEASMPVPRRAGASALYGVLGPALHAAVGGGFARVASLLLAHGAPPNFISDSTAFHG